MSDDLPDEITRPCGRCGKLVTRQRGLGGVWESIVKLEHLTCDTCIQVEQGEEEEEMRRERAEARRATRLARWRDESGVPSKLAAVGWSDVDVTPERAAAIDAARRWGAGELDGLVLIGEFGVGKTWIAGAAANMRLSLEPVRWCSVPALIAASMSDWGSEEKRRAAAILTGADTIVLDDIDKVRATDFVASQLFVAIDNRVQNGGAYIVTTNASMDELHDTFGGAIASRLFGGDSEVYQVDGRDRRL